MSEIRFLATNDNIKKAIDGIDFCKIRNIIIGYDFRHSSLEVLKLLREVLIKNSVVIHAEMPSNTPEMCYLSKFCGNSIMITASHNPVEYNGLKFFVNGIETESNKLTEGYLFNDWELHSYLDIYNHKLKNTKVITCLDYLHKDKVDEFFKKIGVEYIDIKNLIGTEPVYNTKIKEAILERKADYGVFFDPDMDRVLVVNNKGEEISPDTIAYLFIKNNGLKNTVSTIDSLLEGNKCDIGRLHVIDYIKSHNCSFGHELSNHYYFPFNILCSDGMYAVYSVMKHEIQTNLFQSPFTTNIFTKKKIYDIKLPFKKIFVSENTIKYRINDTEWIILRQSETEDSLIRIITTVGSKEQESSWF